MSDPLTLVLSKLPDAKQNGKGWKARCPGHDDREASLSVAKGRTGSALVHCFAGCTIEQIVKVLGLELRDLMSPADLQGLARRKKAGGGGPNPPGDTSARVHARGCTLTEYAELKRLPIDELRGYGLTDMVYCRGRNYLRMNGRFLAGLGEDEGS